MNIPRKILFGFDFEGLALFILFLVLLAAGLIWVIFKLAAIIVPAALIVIGGAAFLSLVFHRWSTATIAARSMRRIEAVLREILALERSGADRVQIQSLESRVRTAAQTLADDAFVRLRKGVARCRRRSRRLPNSTSSQRNAEHLHEWRARERLLHRQLAQLRLVHEVVPDNDPWRRFSTLHLERGWVRWLADHPRPATYIVSTVFVVLVAMVAGVL